MFDDIRIKDFKIMHDYEKEVFIIKNIIVVVAGAMLVFILIELGDSYNLRHLVRLCKAGQEKAQEVSNASRYILCLGYLATID